MTIDAHIASSLMYAARMHDDQRNAVTVRTLLERVTKETDSPKYGTLDEVKAAINSAEEVLAEFEEPLKHVDRIRNCRLATPTRTHLQTQLLQCGKLQRTLEI